MPRRGSVCARPQDHADSLLRLRRATAEDVEDILQQIRSAAEEATAGASAAPAPTLASLQARRGALLAALRRAKLPPGDALDAQRRLQRQSFFQGLVPYLCSSGIASVVGVDDDLGPVLDKGDKGEPLWYVVDSLVMRKLGQDPSAERSSRVPLGGMRPEESHENSELWSQFWTYFRQRSKGQEVMELRPKPKFTQLPAPVAEDSEIGSDAGSDLPETLHGSEEDGDRRWLMGSPSSMGGELLSPPSPLASPVGRPGARLSGVSRTSALPSPPPSMARPRGRRPSGLPMQAAGSVGASGAGRKVVEDLPGAPRRGAVVPKLPQLGVQDDQARTKGIRNFTGYNDYKRVRNLIKEVPDIRVSPKDMYRPGLSLSRLPDELSNGMPGLKAEARVVELRDAVEHLLHIATDEPQQRWSTAVKEYLSAREWRERGALEVAPEPRPLTMRPRENLPVAPPMYKRPWERDEPRSGDASSSLGPQPVAKGGAWQPGTSTALPGASPLRKFADVCSSTFVHPHTASVRFLLNLPPKLDLRGAGYGDQDILALSSALPQAGRLEAVDIGENPRLSDEAVGALLQSLAKHHAPMMHGLSLERCTRLGRDSILLCTKLLGESFVDLQALNLSGLRIGLHEYTDLAAAIEAHPKLSDIRLAETGLGNFDAAGVVRSLIANMQLERLELGWNSLGPAAFEVLGRGVVEHRTIRHLGVANTGACSDPGQLGSPVLALVELLAGDKTLTSLDLSMNGLDGGALLVLEYALRQHPQMQIIEFSRNPFGAEGARPLLRLLAHPGCAELREIKVDECGGGAANKQIGGAELLDEDPSGRYTLNLAHPVQRALLRLLMSRLSERMPGTATSSIIRNVTLREERFAIDGIRKGKHGVWLVPTSGELTFDLYMGEVLLRPEDTGCCAATVVDRMVRRNRMALVGQRKILAVLSQIKATSNESLIGHLLEALGRDFLLTPDQAKALCHTTLKAACARCCGHDRVGTCVKLLPCMLGAAPQLRKFLVGDGVDDLMRVERATRCLLGLDFENPTGHYDLHLGEPADRAVAERLLLLTRWQVQTWKAAGLIDITQHACGKNTRNEIYAGRVFVQGPDEWRLPASGQMSFDYVPLYRPPKDAVAMTSQAWSEVMRQLRHAVFRSAPLSSLGREAEPPAYRKGRAPAVLDLGAMHVAAADVLWVIRSVSGCFWMTCRQLRELLVLFHDRSMRADAMTYLFLRCLDWPVNGKMCRPKFSEADWAKLRSRLGYVNLFPFFQPESSFFSLDLSVPEQKRALHLLIRLSNTEAPGGGNMKGPRIDPAGPSAVPNFQPFTAGIPMSWDSYEAIPSVGVVEVLYLCSMEDVKIRMRRRLAAAVGGWTTLPEDNAELGRLVQWWSVLDDVPQEAVRVLIFLVTYFNSLGEAFTACDANRDGKLNHKEFVLRLQSIGCLLGPRRPASTVPPWSPAGGEDGAPPMEMARTPASTTSVAPRRTAMPKRMAAGNTATSDRADGADEPGSAEEKQMEALTNVYRFLDSSNNGEISRKEFELLEGLRRELWQSMWEFKCHIVDCFGSLEQAWTYADRNLDDVIEFSEFKLLAEAYHFDGPVKQIFMYLDKDDNGRVNMDEWMKLDLIQPDRAPDELGRGAAASPAVRLRTRASTTLEAPEDGFGSPSARMRGRGITLVQDKPPEH